MRTVGQILKETREAKLYTLEEVEKATKIRKELLVALEADDYAKLPPVTFVQGFIKNYAAFLKLDQKKLLAIFRREFPEKRYYPKVMDAFAKPVDNSRLKFTPSRVLGLVVLAIVLSFFIYLWFQYRQFVNPPVLLLASPVEQLTTDSPLISVEGKTGPEVKVLINSQEVQVDTNGEFKEEITLTAPVNKLTVTAVSRFGQKTEVERTVYLKR